MFAKISKDFDSLGLSNFFRNMLIPLASNLHPHFLHSHRWKAFATPSRLSAIKLNTLKSVVMVTFFVTWVVLTLALKYILNK